MRLFAVNKMNAVNFKNPDAFTERKGQKYFSKLLCTPQ